MGLGGGRREVEGGLRVAETGGGRYTASMRSVALAERCAGRRRARSEGSLEAFWESFWRRERSGIEMGYCSILNGERRLKEELNFLKAGRNAEGCGEGDEAC